MRNALRIAIGSLAIVACGHQAPSSAPTMSRSGTNGRQLSRDEQVRQALNRLAFGPRPGDVAAVTAMGVDKWIELQLSPEKIPDAATDAALAGMETQRKRAFELIADHPDPGELQQRFNQRAAEARANPSVVPAAFSSADSQLMRRSQVATQQLTAQIGAARVLRAVASERQLQEVMTDFWENHFSVFLGKSPNRYSMVEYDRDVIRPRALGRFRDLLGAVAKSPQMLFYLDNWQSGVDSAHPNVAEQRIEARRATNGDPLVQSLATLPRRRPRGLNENYARELMELHTLGVDGGYTQKDVQEVARALSGWTIDAPNLGGEFVFRPEQHDAGEKIVLGQTLPAGRGIADGEAVLDLLSRAPATARFITTKLARHFVSDDPPPALVDRCARAFTTTNGDIRETMRCLVSSPEFFSRAAYRAKVKTPFELVASSLRALGAAPDTTPRSAQLVSQLGQPIFGRLTPDGWPDRADAWMNSGAIMNRINFGVRLAAGQVFGVRLATWAPATRLRQLPYDQQVNGVIDELLGSGVSEDTRRILSTGENPMTHAATPAKPPVPQLNGFPALVALALGTPEFQRR